MLAPSLAAFKAIAFPIPLDAPVMKRVFPASFLKCSRYLLYFSGTFFCGHEVEIGLEKTYPVF